MFSPGGSSPYTSTHNANGRRIYIKITIQNKLYTITKQNTYSKYKYTYYNTLQTLQKHPHFTKTSTLYKNIHTLQKHPHLTKTFTPYTNIQTLQKHPYTYKKYDGIFPNTELPTV
jgi:hypothetical protein